MLLHHFCFILIILSFFPVGQTDSFEDSSEYVEALDDAFGSDLKTKKSEEDGAQGKLKKR